MKKIMNWMAVVLTATVVLTAQEGRSETIKIAANSQPVVLTGTSGGAQKSGSCAGYVSKSPNHVLQLNEDKDLRFSLQSSGKPTLLIEGSDGTNVCVMAESDGKVEVPGFWKKGSYSIFVGDRAQGSNPYKLSISQSSR